MVLNRIKTIMNSYNKKPNKDHIWILVILEKSYMNISAHSAAKGMFPAVLARRLTVIWQESWKMVGYLTRLLHFGRLSCKIVQESCKNLAR